MAEPTEPRRRRPPARVLVTKLGLDGHDRGSRLVASYLRDAGMEVVYTSPWQSVDGVVKLALEEDVALIGVSCLATDHLLVPKLLAALAAEDLAHIPVVVGGIIPPEDERALREAGVAEVFHPGATREAIVGRIGELVDAAGIPASS